MTMIENYWAPINFAAEDLLGRGGRLLRDLVTKIKGHEDQTSYWQTIFTQSKVNGCSYRGEDLMHSKWQWPTNTWFQEKLSDHLKALECAALSRETNRLR